MLRILVAVKAVPDPAGASRAAHVADDGRTMGFTVGHPWILNGYDENAVEAALRLRDGSGGTVTAVTVGSDRAVEALRRALAMGVDDAAQLADPAFDGGDPSAVAATLGAFAATTGPWDLILCGRQASDDGNAQVPANLAEVMGWPCVAPAKSLALLGPSLTVTRLSDDGDQTIEISMPAVIAVSSEASEPRRPSVKAVLAARRASIVQRDARSLGLAAVPVRTVIRAHRIEVRVPRVEMIVATDGTEAGSRLAEVLISAGLVK